jgi:ABC-type spermidine/putrescine transport system permease subunit II
MAKSKITKRIRLFMWLVIAIIALPFACVVQASFWLQDLVAGDQFPLYRWKVQKKEKQDD